MATKDPQTMPIQEMISLDETLVVKPAISIEDTVPVKDSTVYRFQKWEYLVKKQLKSGKDDLLNWLDELTGQGWELISGQPVNPGFYIFKKPLQ